MRAWITSEAVKEAPRALRIAAPVSVTFLLNKSVNIISILVSLLSGV